MNTFFDAYLESKKIIQEIAYFKWIDAGKPDGKDLEFWKQAEKEYKYQQKNYWKQFAYPGVLGGYVQYPEVNISSTPINNNFDVEVYLEDISMPEIIRFSNTEYVEYDPCNFPIS